MQEEFRDIPGYEGIYQVSNFGRVKSLARETSNGTGVYISKEKILTQFINKCYYCSYLSKNSKTKTFTVHQLVAMAFLNHTPCGFKLVVNHKDLNKLNNNLSNLELVSHRENTNKKHLKSSSTYTGVSWHKRTQKWRARIQINGIETYLGLFKCELSAALAYQNKLKTL